MKKNFIFIPLILFLITRLFAYDGMMWGEKELFVISTQYFDIIYPEKSKTSAAIIYEKVDSMYEEIAALYDDIPRFKMPIVICPNVQVLNAYWTSYPYNHVVLYDTCMIEDLDVFSEKLLSILRHELTHAYTFNYKNKFWAGLDKVFGDAVNFSALWVTPGIAESASVLSESSFGEGRLNDEFARHPVKQAKFEGNFPDFYDVQGAMDIYPSGTYYMYNAMFFEFLEEKYGRKKYAQFWYRLVNGKTLSLRSAFRKVYGLRFQDAWDMFEDSLQCQSLIAEKDFSDYGINDLLPKENKSGMRFSDLAMTEKGLYFLDYSSSSLYLLESDDNKLKKLFYFSSIESASPSSDGKFIAVNYYSNLASTEKSKVAIYDLENKSWFYFAEDNIFDSKILQYGKDYYLLSTSYQDQKYKIEIRKFEFKNGKLEELSDYSQILGPYFDFYKSAVCLENGRFAFIKVDGLKNSLVLADFEGNILAEYSLDSPDFRMRNLTYSEGKIFFTWTEKASMPQLGYFDLEDKKFFLSREQFSGGIFNPCLKDSSVFYYGKFYKKNKIYSRDFSSFSFNSFNALETDSSLSKKSENEAFEISLSGKKYNPLTSYFKGLLIPASILSSSTYLPENTSSINLPFGLTYISCNPWSKGFLQLGAGYGYTTNSGAISASFNSGTDTDLFNYSLSSQSEFDRYGWKNSNLSLSASTYFSFGRLSSFQLSLSSFTHYGRPNSASPENLSQYFIPYYSQSDDLNYYLYNQDSFSLAYACLKKVDRGLYSKAGAVFSSVFYYQYNARIPENFQVYANALELGFGSLFYFPGFALNNPYSDRFTYDFPFKLGFNIMSLNDNSLRFASSRLISLGNFNSQSYPVLLSSSFEGILFSWDIQKAGKLFPFVYYHRLNLTFNAYFMLFALDSQVKSFHLLYLADYFKGNLASSANFFLGPRLELTLGPNFGQLTKSQARIFAELIFEAYNSDVSFPLNFTLGISSSY
ncbi:MAG: hypothetical protein K5839_02980 [Treponemataceae bacterium]|nr:hypothetical protein [Treponemataceae bacterium]